MTIKEMLEKRAQLVNNAREIQNKAEKENRDQTDDEQRQFDEIMADVDKLADEIKTEETKQRRSTWLEDQEKLLEESRGRQTNMSQANKGQRQQQDQEPQIIEMRTRKCKIELAGVRGSKDYEKAFKRYLRTGHQDGSLMPVEKENRALQQDLDVQGGFLAPDRFSAEILMDLDDLMFMREICNVLPPIAGHTNLGVPTLDTDVSDAEWTSEIATASEDSSMEFGKRNMSTSPIRKYIKLSRTLIRAVPGIEAIVRQRLAYKLAIPQENAFLNGHGTGRPLGVFVASNNGISTSRDVSTGNTTTEIRFDGLIEALYSIKGQYRKLGGFNWIFHRDGVKQIRKLKDGEGRYIWEASVRAGEPDTILNWPVRESEYAPNTFTTGQYVGILGNFKVGYWILDSLDMEIQVLLELYALTNQVAYLIGAETDGGPVQQNAFARVKLA